jgi:hemoglobin
VDLENPYEMLGGRDAVSSLAERFYDVMERDEPALTATHELDETGKVCRRSRERFGLFLAGWLGGPQDYMQQHGHPRLRMRHAGVPIDTAMAEAWVRSMKTAMAELKVEGPVRDFLEARFTEVAMFLRNKPDEA